MNKFKSNPCSNQGSRKQFAGHPIHNVYCFSNERFVLWARVMQDGSPRRRIPDWWVEWSSWNPRYKFYQCPRTEHFTKTIPAIAKVPIRCYWSWGKWRAEFIFMIWWCQTASHAIEPEWLGYNHKVVTILIQPKKQQRPSSVATLNTNCWVWTNFVMKTIPNCLANIKATRFVWPCIIKVIINSTRLISFWKKNSNVAVNVLKRLLLNSFLNVFLFRQTLSFFIAFSLKGILTCP